jgi:hypothetical protein
MSTRRISAMRAMRAMRAMQAMHAVTSQSECADESGSPIAN